ncbi:MAG: DUF4276 family protein [Bacteroidales bacterium]
MMEVQLVVEDKLQDAVLKCILQKFQPQIVLRPTAGLRGIEYIKGKIDGYHRASKFCPYIVLVDLDKEECAPDLIRKWLKSPKINSFYLRIAVSEVEAWLMADRKGFSKFLSIPIDLIPTDTETILNPKESLISWARKSRKKKIKGLIPKGTSSIGPEYNRLLSEFIFNYWNINEACKHNDSLRRTVERIKEM